MSRSDMVYVDDILDSIDLIFQYVRNQSEIDFASNILLQDAVTRRFEIIGEASGKISDTLKLSYPQVKWGLMKAMRNKLIHEYFGVSAYTLYQTIKIDLPELQEQLIKLKE
jgi:uncharacterized protein with HEPN domain